MIADRQPLSLWTALAIVLCLFVLLMQPPAASAVANFDSNGSLGTSLAAQTDTAQQECDAALAEPPIVHPILMKQAGIRPFTGSRYSQAVTGALGYPDSNCSGQVRTASGQIQDLRKGSWRPIWGQSVGGWAGNEGGVSRIFVEPGHADPGYGYLFNDCVPGKGFHPVRILLQLKLKDETTKELTAEKDYVLQVPVKGNCNAARHSKQVAERQMERNYTSSPLGQAAQQSVQASESECQSTDSASPHPQWHAHFGFRTLDGQPTHAVSPGELVRFVYRVAGGNVDSFNMEADTEAPMYHFPRAMEILKRGSHPQWSKAGGNPHWVIKSLCHWQVKKKISFLVKVDRQVSSHQQLCMPFDVWARTGGKVEPYDPPVQRVCIAVR